MLRHVGKYVDQGLNAPFGARCFLTEGHVPVEGFGPCEVLMHLLALGAF